MPHWGVPFQRHWLSSQCLEASHYDTFRHNFCRVLFLSRPTKVRYSFRMTTASIVRTSIPILALCTVLFFATYHLSESPAIWYDEGFFEQLAINVSHGGAQVMELAPGRYLSSWSISAGYPLVYPMALSFATFGTSVFTARIVPATYLVLFVLASYFLVRRQYGAVPAGIAVSLIATFPILYGNGKSVLGEVPALFWFMLGLGALYALEKSDYKSVWSALLAGLFLGLSFAAKFTFMLIVPAVAIVFVLKFKTIRTHLTPKALIAGIIGFMLPVLLWLFLQFGSEDSLTTTLSFFANPYGYGGEALGAGILTNLVRFVTETTPFYFLAIFVPWVASVVLRKRSVTTAELFALVFSVFVVLAYLRTPGWYRYFFPAMMVTLVFVAPALLHLKEVILSRLPKLRLFRFVLYGGLALLVLLQGYQLAGHSYVASYYHSTRTQELTRYFATLSPDTTFFLYNVPEIAIFLPTRTYYQFVMPHEDQPFGREALPLLISGVPELVVVNAETYQKDPAPFIRYTVKDRVSHYLVLKQL